MRELSFNLGDIFVACVVIFLVGSGQPLPAICILLCLILAELSRIRKAIGAAPAHPGEGETP